MENTIFLENIKYLVTCDNEDNYILAVKLTSSMSLLMH